MLVVVDYAERWAVPDLLQLLPDTAAAAGAVVRVLLLARPTGWWWSGLCQQIPRAVGRPEVEPDDLLLAPVEETTLCDPEEARRDLFHQARDRFCGLLGVPDPDRIVAPAGLDSYPDYHLVLAVHMAALVLVLAAHDHDTTNGGDRSGSAPLWAGGWGAEPVEVSQFLLTRERLHWEAVFTRAKPPLLTEPDAMGQAVYLATLTGPVHYRDGLAALTRAGVESAQPPGQILKDHAHCYPPPGNQTVLEPLYPDRLGEDFIGLLTPASSPRPTAGMRSGNRAAFPTDPWATVASARLLLPRASDTPGPAAAWVHPALTTLIETAHRWPDIASDVLFPLLRDCPHLALAAGGAALVSLTALPGIPLDLLAAIEEHLPAHRHIDLDVGIAALAQRLTEHRLATTADRAERARLHYNLARCLHRAGLHDQALDTSHQAVLIWRQLADLDHAMQLPSLAVSLNNHAVLLAQVGRRDEAVPVSQEAVDTYRELAALDRDTHLAGLAMSVHNHAGNLFKVGR
ncbi:tetratricopeptide repeat protein, partial [Streptomyces massasporeus]